jgi:hypothetical protein
MECLPPFDFIPWNKNMIQGGNMIKNVGDAKWDIIDYRVLFAGDRGRHTYWDKSGDKSDQSASQKSMLSSIHH